MDIPRVVGEALEAVPAAAGRHARRPCSTPTPAPAPPRGGHRRRRPHARPEHRLVRPRPDGPRARPRGRPHGGRQVVRHARRALLDLLRAARSASFTRGETEYGDRLAAARRLREDQRHDRGGGRSLPRYEHRAYYNAPAVEARSRRSSPARRSTSSWPSSSSSAIFWIGVPTATPTDQRRRRHPGLAPPGRPASRPGDELLAVNGVRRGRRRRAASRTAAPGRHARRHGHGARRARRHRSLSGPRAPGARTSPATPSRRDRRRSAPSASRSTQVRGPRSLRVRRAALARARTSPGS